MKTPLSCVALLLLATCKPDAAAPSRPSPTPAGTGSANDTTPVESAKPGAPATVPPSFDCAKAVSEAEKLVCGDAELAALDRQLAARYGEAKDADPAIQRGWAKGRDDCLKGQDPRVWVGVELPSEVR